MAEKYNTILQLAADTEKKVTGSAEEWRRFMDTAGRFCKYTFQDQLLIYAQRPRAAACAPITVWDKMGCWVNRGAKGIALVDTASPRQKLKYVFDMADVTPERKKDGHLPYIWSVNPEHEQAVIDALEAVYGKTDAKYPFADRVMELMMEAAKGVYEESARRIAPYVKGSRLEGEEWRSFSVRVYGAMLESAHCEVMGACGSDIRPQKYSFYDIKYFNTHGALCMLGNEINAFVRPVIAEIGRAVREYEKQKEETKVVQTHIEGKNAGQGQKSLASTPETGYNALKRESTIENSRKENSDTERGGAYGTDVQTGRGLPGAGYRNGRAAGRGTEEIRPASEKIPDGEQGRGVFGAPSGQRTDAAPVRDTGTGRGADGADRRADGGGHGSGRSAQSAGPDAMGQKDEQHPALGGGDRAGGDDLHLNNGMQPDAGRKEPDNGAAPLSGSFQQETGMPDNGHSSGPDPLPGVFPHGRASAGITPEVRKGVLCSDSFLSHKRPEIAGYFAAEPDAGLQMEYFKGCFTFRTYYGLDVAGISVGFHASEKGLHINMSGRPGAENEALLSWEDARFFVNSYIEDGTYLFPGEKAEQAHTDEVYEQLDLFSMLARQAGGMDTAGLSGGTVPFSKYRMPQDQIDEILRSGGGRDDSRKRIYAKYQQGKTPEEMAAFLRKEYGVTGKGFTFDGKKFAVWFDADGMRIGRGMSAWENTVLSMPWAEIEQNIRPQVENGTYMSAPEIYLVDEAERGRIANGIYFFFRDGLGELPEGLGLKATDHPDSHAALVRMLADPEGIECLAGHMDTALRQLETGEKQLRTRFRMRPEELRRELDNLMVHKLSFPAPESVHIRRADFITQDEIDERLTHGSGFEDGKFRIYDFFKEGHGPADAAAFLKKEYGDGGSSHGLTGADDSWEDHNSKGICLKKGDIHVPDTEILLPWNTVAKRIGKLIAEDKYLSADGKKAYLEYKKRQAEKERDKELTKKERETKAACKAAIEKTIAEKFDGLRLAEGAAGTVIREYGAERVSYVLANTVTHLKSDGRFSSGNKEWAESIEPYAMIKNRDLVVTAHPAVLDGFIDQARIYIEHEKVAVQHGQEKTVESMDGVSVFPGADMPVENVKSGNAGVDQVSAMSAGMAETKERSSVEDAESQAYYAVSLMPDNSADNYYISIMDGSTGVEIRPYRDSFGKLPAFQTVGEAADYCNRNGIDLQNAHEVDQWHSIEVEREKGKSRQGKDAPGQDASGHNAGMPPGMETVPEKDNVLPEPHEAAASTVYPGDKNGMPYDIIVEKMHFGQEKDAPETAARNDRPAAANFRITDDMLGTGAVKEKFRRNVEAIRTLERVEGENRAATPQEQHILSQYVGWGGLADAFDESRNAWAGEYRELKSLLSPGEYASARESTLNSHYTSPVVIRSIYSVLERMGFETGSILDIITIRLIQENRYCICGKVT